MVRQVLGSNQELRKRDFCINLDFIPEMALYVPGNKKFQGRQVISFRHDSNYYKNGIIDKVNGVFGNKYTYYRQTRT